jgi:hypothetical protein
MRATTLRREAAPAAPPAAFAYASDAAGVLVLAGEAAALSGFDSDFASGFASELAAVPLADAAAFEPLEPPRKSVTYQPEPFS